MNDLEMRLQQMLTDKGATVSADRTRHQATLKRARTRRVGTAALATVVLLGVVAGGVAAVRTLGEPRALDPAGVGEGEEAGTSGWDASVTNEYPEIARGTFQGRTWYLEGRREELAEGVDEVVLDFVIEPAQDGGTPLSATTRVVPGDDELLIEELAIPDEGTRAVFGATLKGTSSVQAVLDDGSRIDGFLATDYDSRSTITANYFVMFVPADQDGYVFARDHLGIDNEQEPIGNAPELDRETSPLISGAFNRVLWTADSEPSGSDEVCLSIVFDDGAPAQGCFRQETGERLLLRAEELGRGAKALVGFVPFDHQNLELTIEGRTTSLSTPFPAEPHETLGFPFAVVVPADAHGSVSATDSNGEEVSIDF